MTGGRGVFTMEFSHYDEVPAQIADKIIEENNFIKAEVVYTLRYELTPHLIDVFCRRTEMSLWIHHKKALDAANIVAELMAKEYSWDENKKNQEIEFYMDYIKKSVSFIT